MDTKLELEKAAQALAALDLQIADAEAAIKSATATIAIAVGPDEAKKWIAERAAQQALIDEFLVPKRPGLEADVSAARRAIAYQQADARAVALAAETAENMTMLAAAGRILEEVLDDATELAVEIKRRYMLLGSQLSETQLLGQQGHAFPAMPTVEVRSLEQIFDHLAKYEKVNWQISRQLKARLDTAGTWQGGHNG